MVRMAGITLALLAGLFVGCGGNGDSKTVEQGSPEHGMHMEHGGTAETAETAAPAGAMNAKCPVMGEEVDPEVFTEYRGKKVYFCCDECLEKFKKDPDRYFAKAYPHASGR